MVSSIWDLMQECHILMGRVQFCFPGKFIWRKILLAECDISSRDFSVSRLFSIFLEYNSRGHGDHGDYGGCVGHGFRVGHGGRGGYGGLVVREGFQKSKWFKMDFAIRRRTPPPLPLMEQISSHFLANFFLLQLNPTYMKQILHFKNITFKSSCNWFKIHILRLVPSWLVSNAFDFHYLKEPFKAYF